MMPAKLLLLSCFLGLPFMVAATGIPVSQTDSVKYRGYRLELTNFQKIKEKTDWLKISFTVVNSGRMNVDLSRKGTEHWVVFNFDPSIFRAKLGGYRNNIRRQLIKEGFKLEAGKTIGKVELKIPNVLPAPPKIKKEPLATSDNRHSKNNGDQNTAQRFAWNAPESPTLPGSEFAEKGSGQEVIPVKTEERKEAACPDIFISDLKIIKQEEKWAIIQYTITNQGEGAFHLFGKSKSEHDNLFVRAYLSGVTTMTRGALPIGGKAITEELRQKNELLRGESLTAQIKVDIRKKTRYMKSLILNLESHQFASECDRKNNSQGIVLR
ncbi:MAG: hypothetical protein AAFZ15_19840 [Bacteroidota bacterium]